MANSYSLISINGGTLTLHDGAQLVNSNTSSTAGAAVRMISGAFYMDGGQISNNEVLTSNGGGVYMTSGTFTMSGTAIISGNTAFNNGGGVCVDGGTFIMTNGTISGNHTYTGSGGGVYTGNTAVIFAKRGGTITDDNTSDYTFPVVAIFGGYAGTSNAGPAVRLYYDSDAMSGYEYIDPLDNVNTQSNY
jgi:hypothetical protein